MHISSSLFSGKYIEVVIRDGQTTIETGVMRKEEALQFAKDLHKAAADIESLVEQGY